MKNKKLLPNLLLVLVLTFSCGTSDNVSNTSDIDTTSQTTTTHDTFTTSDHTTTATTTTTPIIEIDDEILKNKAYEAINKDELVFAGTYLQEQITTSTNVLISSSKVEFTVLLSNDRYYQKNYTDSMSCYKNEENGLAEHIWVNPKTNTIETELVSLKMGYDDSGYPIYDNVLYDEYFYNPFSNITIDDIKISNEKEVTIDFSDEILNDITRLLVGLEDLQGTYNKVSIKYSGTNNDDLKILGINFYGEDKPQGELTLDSIITYNIDLKFTSREEQYIYDAEIQETLPEHELIDIYFDALSGGNFKIDLEIFDLLSNQLIENYNFILCREIFLLEDKISNQTSGLYQFDETNYIADFIESNPYVEGKYMLTTSVTSMPISMLVYTLDLNFKNEIFKYIGDNTFVIPAGIYKQNGGYMKDSCPFENMLPTRIFTDLLSIQDGSIFIKFDENKMPTITYVNFESGSTGTFNAKYTLTFTQIGGVTSPISYENGDILSQQTFDQVEYANDLFEYYSVQGLIPFYMPFSEDYSRGYYMVSLPISFMGYEGSLTLNYYDIHRLTFEEFKSQYTTLLLDKGWLLTQIDEDNYSVILKDDDTKAFTLEFNIDNFNNCYELNLDFIS